MVLQRVLSANILCDLLRDAINLAQGIGEISYASGLLGELSGKDLAGVARLTAADVLAEEQPDAVNGGTVEVLHAADGLLQRGRGGVVVAVGDDEQYLLGLLAILGEIVGGGDDGVVERGAPGGT